MMMPASTAEQQSMALRYELLATPNATRDGPTEQQQQRETADETDRPPMSVIVVSSPATQDGTPNSSLTRRDGRGSSMSSIFSAPFRLQPRSTMAVSAPGRDGAVRGRKRSAQSMSMNNSKLGSDSRLTVKQPIIVSGKPSLPVIPSAATPPRDTRRGHGRVDHTVINFQCLSLQSPKRKDPCSSPPVHFSSPPQSLACVPSTSGLPPSSSSSSSGVTTQRPAMVPGSVGSFQSPAVSSGIQPRSSFTPVYNSASPGGSLRSHGSGSIGSNTRMNVSARAAVLSPGQSNCGGSAMSSPKIAPLTVLQDRGTKVPNRDSHSRLPPLPSGGVSSLWFSLDSSQSGSNGDENDKSPRDGDAKMLPPRTVHCRRPSSDSISTVHNSVLSPLPRPSPKRSPGVFLSPASMSRAPKATTPGSKQRRLEQYSSPNQRNRRLDQYSSPNQRTPRTPQTPLPRVTLTPRSGGSRRSRQSGQGLPRFPSPSDTDMDVTSPFLNSTAAASLRVASSGGGGNEVEGPPCRNLSNIKCLFATSSNSLALSADGSANEGKEGSTSGSARGRGKAPFPVLNLSSNISSETSEAKPSGEPSHGANDLGGGTFLGIQTVSLLNSSRPGGFLQAMMEERAGMNAEMGSVSDIDDDEGFILASPSAIEEERLASCQPARQRRRRSCDRFSNTASAPRESPTLSPNASNTNLAGMNYVTSSTSLFGMDIAHPTDQTGAIAPKTSCESLSTKKTGSLPTSQDVNSLKRRMSDASFDSVGLALDGTGGRDLVTPPTVPNPGTPPPLSPKGGYFEPSVMPEATARHNSAGKQKSSVCVAGADRQSVTMAIARMAAEAQGHADSSPVL